jgi:type VII secretion-associated serine protease mycosin
VWAGVLGPCASASVAASAAAPVSPSASAAASASPAASAAPLPEAGSFEWPLAAACFDAPRVWALSTGAGITVAVVDTGVDAADPDLAGRVLPGVDLTGQAADGRIDTSADSHGTSVAGVIAADGASGGPGRMTGLAPGALILPVRISASNTAQEPAAVAEGIAYAASHGARIINLSLGTPIDLPEIRDAVTSAIRHGVLIVAAAGNSGRAGNQPLYPAAIPGVLAVAGTARDGSVWTQGESGPYVALAAPAEEIYSTSDTSGHLTSAGTSYAAPYVSAAAALLWSRYPDESAGQIITRLLETADPVGTAAHGRDDESGFGRVDPYRALIAPVPKNTGDPLLAAPSAAAISVEASVGSGSAVPVWTISSGAAAAAVIGLTAFFWNRRRRARPGTAPTTSPRVSARTVKNKGSR